MTVRLSLWRRLLARIERALRPRPQAREVLSAETGKWNRHGAPGEPWISKRKPGGDA